MVRFDQEKAVDLMQEYMDEHGGALVCGMKEGEGATVLVSGNPAMIAGAIEASIRNLAFRTGLPIKTIMAAITEMIEAADQDDITQEPG